MDGFKKYYKGIPLADMRCFKCKKYILNKFCNELIKCGLNSSSYGVEEMVAMFLVIVCHRVCNRMIQERLQHSGSSSNLCLS